MSGHYSAHHTKLLIYCRNKFQEDKVVKVFTNEKEPSKSWKKQMNLHVYVQLESWGFKAGVKTLGDKKH